MTQSAEKVSVGVVVIGRNEGERLALCLRSLVPQGHPVVYVDSGSTDGSCAFARGMGVDVIELPPGTSFTAALARNAGMNRFLETTTDIEFIQFVDGDCEVVATWIGKAAAALEANQTIAVVCGRRRERFPMASVYNRLCDMEWNTPPGEATECGGDAMFRARPLKESGGYKEDLIAGEEPELCARLRSAGWKILRLDAEMTLHDAAMMHFGQWWKRSVRNGHAFAEGAALHGASAVRYWNQQARSNWVWGAALPLLALALAWPTRGISLVIAAALYAVLVAKIYRYGISRQRPSADAAIYAVFCVLGKLPQAVGQASYYFRRVLGRRNSLIEYKTSTPTDGALIGSGL